MSDSRNALAAKRRGNRNALALMLAEAERRHSFGGTPNDPTKPILVNPDGSYSTEKVAHYGTDDGYVVLPTIVDGRDVGADAAFDMYRAGRNFPVGRFPTETEAGEYAMQRHLREERMRRPEALMLIEAMRRHGSIR